MQNNRAHREYSCQQMNVAALQAQTLRSNKSNRFKSNNDHSSSQADLLPKLTLPTCKENITNVQREHYQRAKRTLLTCKENITNVQREHWVNVEHDGYRYPHTTQRVKGANKTLAVSFEGSLAEVQNQWHTHTHTHARAPCLPVQCMYVITVHASLCEQSAHSEHEKRKKERHTPRKTLTIASPSVESPMTGVADI